MPFINLKIFILSKNNLSKNSFVLYPAQFWTHKNHIRLILAAQIMKEQNINLKMVFCGLDRGNKDYIIDTVKKLDLEEGKKLQEECLIKGEKKDIIVALHFPPFISNFVKIME